MFTTSKATVIIGIGICIMWCQWVWTDDRMRMPLWWCINDNSTAIIGRCDAIYFGRYNLPRITFHCWLRRIYARHIDFLLFLNRILLQSYDHFTRIIACTWITIQRGGRFNGAIVDARNDHSLCACVVLNGIITNADILFNGRIAEYWTRIIWWATIDRRCFNDIIASCIANTANRIGWIHFMRALITFYRMGVITRATSS